MILNLDFTSFIFGMMAGFVILILIEWIYMFGGKR